MSLTITGRQRRLFYDVVVCRISAIDSVSYAVTAQEWEKARRLGCEYADLLRLVTDDLGWGEEQEEAVEFTTPPDVLKRALEMIKREAGHENDVQRRERLIVAELQIEREDTVEACDEILAQLEVTPE